MPKHYSREIKEQVLRELANGVPMSQLSRDYGPTPVTIGKWRAEAASGAGSAGGRTMEEVMKENAYLKRQNAFLKKAATWFAREAEAPMTGTRSID